MKLERTLEQYANCTPAAVAGGSQAQMMYFVEAAKKDIATLAVMVAEYEKANVAYVDANTALIRENAKLREAMEGIVHFSDALNFREDHLSKALAQWIEAGRAALPASSTTGEAA